MALCKWCKRGGLLGGLSDRGLCKNCEPVVGVDVAKRVAVIEDSMKLMQESRKWDFELSRCEMILENAEAMLGYEKRGIHTLTPVPSELLRHYGPKRDQLVLKVFECRVEEILGRLEASITVEEKVRQLSELLDKIRENKPKSQNPMHLSILERRVHRLIHQTQLSSYCDEAIVAESEGDSEEALRLYREALAFLKLRDVDEPYRQGSIWAIEEKIEELEEGLAVRQDS